MKAFFYPNRRDNMIVLEDISKKFTHEDKTIPAVENVNLKIKRNSIHGIIGYSGAGKSTLVRIINLLEKPDAGKVIVDDVELTKLNKKELREKRKEIGMIFQDFNLFNLRTVYENIAFPLYNSKLSKEEIEIRVNELLRLVELEDKKNSYPSTLSGGQKQRVAIARSLANNPKILLCDEATSALDPKTTQSILKLLKKVNEELEITIVVITHQMEVVKEICTRASVMKDGKIICTSNVVELFTESRNEELKDFFNSQDYTSIIDKLRKNKELILYKEVIKISYVGDITHEAIISKVSKKFLVDISILFGEIEYINDVFLGHLIIGISGSNQNVKKSIIYFKERGLNLEVISL